MKRKQLYLPLPLPKLLIIFICIVILFTLSASFFRTEANILPSRSLKISDSNPGATNVTYNFGFTVATAGTLGSIVFELCSNDPFPLTPCTPPAGLDLSSATLVSQTGETGFSIDASSTANKIVLSRAPAAAAAIPVTYIFDNVTNPSGQGSYYGRFLTYATSDASGSPTDKSGIAWVTNNAFSVNTEVPPYLLFCTAVTIPALDCANATGSNIDFGNFSASSTSAGTSQFLVATNAQAGYNVTVNGITMTSGINIIPELTTQTFAAPGSSQFGMNLRANTIPTAGVDPIGPGTGTIDSNYNTPDQYRFNSGDFVASSSTSSDFRKYTTTYIVNINTSQPAGVYSTTITYICLASF